MDCGFPSRFTKYSRQLQCFLFKDDPTLPISTVRLTQTSLHVFKSAAGLSLACAAGSCAALGLAAEIDSLPPPAQVHADKSDWWSFKPVTRPPLPEVKSKKWATTPIDLFILAKLEQEKL